MEIQQVRLDNANRILTELNINKAEFGRRLGKSPQNISGLLGVNSNRNIGQRMAREIEKVFNKPVGWLDKLDEHYPRTYQDNSCSAYCRRASQAAKEYIKSRKEWLHDHRYATRAVEEDFRRWLSTVNIDLLPPVGRYDYSISSGRTGQFSLNLFVPLPGFNRWDIPPFEDEQPDYVAIALMPERTVDQVSYFIIGRPEYMQLAETFSADYLDISIEKSYSSGGSVYLSLIIDSVDNRVFSSKTSIQQKKIQQKPESKTAVRDFQLFEPVAFPA